MRGGGTPSAWHMKRAVPARGRVWLSGFSTMDGGTERHQRRAAINTGRRLSTRLGRHSTTLSTLNREVGGGDRVVAGPGGGGPAEVDAAVLGSDISDDQVPVAQDFGVVHVDGFAVCPAPGDDGQGVPRGHALQHHGLVERRRDVLGTGDDPGSLARFRVRSCAGEKSVLKQRKGRLLGLA